MKKWFKDVSSREVQLLPIELRGHSDGRRGSDVTDKESGYVVMWYGKNACNWSYQVAFNCHQSYDNNMWQVFLFDDKDELMKVLSYPSMTILPPVWNREFGGVDYFDYVCIMERINKNIPPKFAFPIDYSREGKFIHFARFPNGVTAQDVIQRGAAYEILAIKAESDQMMTAIGMSAMGQFGKLPCKPDHNGECLVCDSWLSDYPFPFTCKAVY